MAGSVTFEPTDAQGIAQLTISNPGKLNALSVAMWRELREAFVDIAKLVDAPRVLIVRGDGGTFVAGADIEEFPDFRFDEGTLRAYHEDTVAPALRAMVNCDTPLVAQIDGACVGGGLEIAACCDLRVCGKSSRFGVPIGKLGFPMAPSEVEIVNRMVPLSLLHELLLEGRLIDADEARLRGLVNRVVADDGVAAEALATAQRIAALSPQALRINKHTLRLHASGGLSESARRQLFSYADSREHREGLSAFLEKRPPRF